MFRFKQRIAAIAACWFFCGMAVALAQTGGPTFYPNRNPPPTMEREYPPVPGRTILGGENGYRGQYGPPDYPPYSHNYPPAIFPNASHGLSSMLLSNDPVTLSAQKTTCERSRHSEPT